jgi:hypothetical protein
MYNCQGTDYKMMYKYKGSSTNDVQLITRANLQIKEDWCTIAQETEYKTMYKIQGLIYKFTEGWCTITQGTEYKTMYNYKG